MVVGGGGVGSDALLSSSPSLIWLQLGFGLARAVTIETCAPGGGGWFKVIIISIHIPIYE